MLDFHSHILPAMDDGATDVGVSLDLLRRTKEQGVDGIVASSHFYPENEEPDAFLKRRKEAATVLLRAMRDEKRPLPEVYLGAEVAYYPGIGRSLSIRRLAVAGTQTILVEMPFSRWNPSVLDDLMNLKKTVGLNPVLAHIERYPAYRDPALLTHLSDNGIGIQSNASNFTGFFTRGRALRLLSLGLITFLGSDCHNLTTRTQAIGDALSVIEKKFGGEALDDLEDNAKRYLRGAVSLNSVPQEKNDKENE